jgi:hypothetical protein
MGQLLLAKTQNRVSIQYPAVQDNRSHCLSLASNKARDNWTKTAPYLIKYKQKWERAVKKSDER